MGGVDFLGGLSDPSGRYDNTLSDTLEEKLFGAP